MKRTDLAAARRYARALLEVAFASAEGNPAALRVELEQAHALLSAQAPLREALAHPALPLETKRRLVASIWEAASPLLRRLLGVLVDRGRVALLGPIAQAFGELWNAARGVVPAQAISAAPLTAEQEAALSRALGEATGREVELQPTVDPHLLGGLVVRIEGRVYDGSVKGRLQGLRERLAGAAEH